MNYNDSKFTLNYKTIVFVIILVIYSSLTYSQETKTTISGQILDDATETPVENVIIRLFAVKDSIVVSSNLTDADGKFNVVAKSAGNYYLKANLIGFESKKVTVKVDGTNAVINLNEIKIKSSSIDLDEVKIEGNYRLKIDVDKKIYKIDANAVSANGTAGDVLQNIPSVFVNQNGKVTLRGGKVKIYVNGKPSGILGISRSQILDYIPASLIESIEVINDPSSKYDADGSSGIINIILKNQKKPGINGLIMLSAGTHDRYNASFNFNYNYKKLSLFTSYDIKSINIASQETKNRFDQQGTEKHVNQTRDFFSKTINQNYRFRTEYAFNKKNVLGFSFLNSKTIDKDLNHVKYEHFDDMLVLTDLYNRRIYEKDNDNSNNYTLNYTKKFKKSQQQLTADLFFSKGKENTVGDIYQQYFNLDGTPSSQLPVIANTYNFNTENNVVGQIDYEQPLNKKAKMEFGYKIRSKNTKASYRIDYYYQPLDIFITDTNISNDFNYDLLVNAGYATYRNKHESFSYKLGVRVEQTNIQFDVSNDGTQHNQNYTDFFPSIHLLKEFKNNNKLTFRYSRRIDRPSFREINPLQQYNDPFFLNKGNPNLLPEYTNSFDVTHTKSWKQSSISGSLYYRQATGSIQKIVELQSNGVTVTNYQNLNSSKDIGTEITAYFQLYNWWKINSSLNFYKSIIDGSNIGEEYKTDNYSFNGKVNNNFTLWKKSILQVSGNYQSPTYSPLIKNYGQYYVDASFKQDFMNKKLSLSLRCTDIFHTQKRDYDLTGSNFSVNSRSTRDSRVIYLGITFRPFRNNKKIDEPEENEENNSESNDY